MTATPSSVTNNDHDDVLVEKAVTILVRELGATDAGRFLAMPAGQRMESVKRHRRWQEGLDQGGFFDQVFSERDQG